MVKKSARGLAHSKTWRPRLRPRSSRSVLDCGSPSAFAARHSAASARRRLPLSSTGQWLLKSFQTFLASFADGFRLEECENDLAKKLNVVGWLAFERLIERIVF